METVNTTSTVLITSNALINRLLDRVPQRTTVGRDGVNYDVDLIDLDLTINTVQDDVSVMTDPTISSAYVRARVVAGGLRFFKTSSAESEAG